MPWNLSTWSKFVLFWRLIVRIGSDEYRAQLEKILDEYTSLDAEKRLYDKKAQSSATLSMYGIFGYLVAQFGILAQYVHM